MPTCVECAHVPDEFDAPSPVGSVRGCLPLVDPVPCTADRGRPAGGRSVHSGGSEGASRAAPQRAAYRCAVLRRRSQHAVRKFPGRRRGARRTRGAREGRVRRPRRQPRRPLLSLSPNRVARLKRFDLDWRAALGKLDRAKLSPPAQSDLDALTSTIQNNLKQLDADAAAIAELAPALPFAPEVIALYESRVRMEDVNAQQAAGTVTAIVREIAQVRAQIEAGLAGKTGADAVRVSRLVAGRAADGTDSLRASLTNWFNHFNGYDPLFTWWMGMPFKQADAALQGYAAFLRDRVAPADLVAASSAAGGGDSARARAEVQPGAGPCDADGASAGRDDPRRPALHGERAAGRWRTRRDAAGARREVLRGLARGAQDARLRRVVQERAGRLPLHPRDERADARAREGAAAVGHSEKDRRQRHSGRRPRPPRAPAGSGGRDDPVLAGGADRARPERARVVRGGDAEGVARDGLRRRLEEGGREGEGHAPAARRSARRDSRDAVRGGRLPAQARSDHRPAGRRRIAAHEHDVAGASAREPVLHGRIADHRVVPDRHDGVRRAHAEHARQQHAVLARDRASTR